MAVVGALNVLLTANSQKFDSSLKKAEGSAGHFGSAMAKIGQIVASLSIEKVLSKVTRAVINMTEKAFTSVDTMGRMAAELGVSTEKFTELEYAARDAGMSSQQFAEGMQRMVQTLGHASAMGGIAATNFSRVGLNLKQLTSESPTQAFMQIATAVQHASGSFNKAAIAQAAFGRNGLSLLPMLEEGGNGLKKLAAEAQKSGYAFNDIQYRQLDDARRAIDRLKLIMAGLGRQIAIQVSPYIEAMANQLDALGPKGESMGVRVSGALHYIASGAAKVGDVFQVVEGVVQGVEGTMAAMAAVLFKVLSWLGDAVAKAEHLAGIHIGVGGAAKDANYLSEGFKSTAQSKLNGMKKSFESPWDSTSVNNYFNKVNAQANALATKQAAADKKNRGAGKSMSPAQEQAQQHVAGTIARLQQQVATLGMSAKAMAVYKLKTEGATAAQIAQATALEGQIAAHKALVEKQRKAAEEIKRKQAAAIAAHKRLMAQGQHVKVASETPIERLKAKLFALQGLLLHGAISWHTYAEAVRKANAALTARDANKRAGAMEVDGSAAGLATQMSNHYFKPGTQAAVTLGHHPEHKPLTHRMAEGLPHAPPGEHLHLEAMAPRGVKAMAEAKQAKTDQTPAKRMASLLSQMLIESRLQTVYERTISTQSVKTVSI